MDHLDEDHFDEQFDTILEESKNPNNLSGFLKKSVESSQNSVSTDNQKLLREI